MNRTLAALPADEQHVLFQHLEPLHLNAPERIVRRGEILDKVIFPSSALISVWGERNDAIEISVIGDDGVAGSFCGLETGEAPFEMRVATSGEAHALPRETFQRLLRDMSTLRARVLTLVHRELRSLAEMSALRASREMIDRLALRLDDRFAKARSTELRITHDELSDLLGVRRPGVTLALQTLEERHAIRARRGRISLIDRAALLRPRAVRRQPDSLV
jgi:CRP-like cAMP-binding protein